jgi:hypothetical protein
MTESVHAGASSTATGEPSIAVGGWGIELIRGLVIVNLVLVALQALSAGFFLSGDGRGVNAHSAGAKALLGVVLIQAVGAAVLWRRRRLPGWVAGNCLVPLVIVLLEMGLGRSKQYWLHLPLGVLIFGGLTRQLGRLEALRLARRSH